MTIYGTAYGVISPKERPQKPVLKERPQKKEVHKVKIDLNNSAGEAEIYIDGNKMNTSGGFTLSGLGKSHTLTITITNFILEN